MRSRYRSRPERYNLPLLVSVFLGIVATVLTAERAPGIIPTILALPIIAALQNHLQILQHEAAHGNLARSRTLNEWLGEIFCSWPFFALLKPYRHFHFEHHRHLLDPERDPEVDFYREQGYRFERLALGTRVKLALLDLSGIHAIRFFWSYQRYLWTEGRKTRAIRPGAREKIGVLVLIAWIASMAIFPEWGRIAFVYWILPQFTILFFLLKLQGYGEHEARTDRIETCTNDRRVGRIEAFFVSPLNSNLHRTHHLRPELPWYELAVENPRRPMPGPRR